jgi:hypothetical protein
MKTLLKAATTLAFMFFCANLSFGQVEMPSIDITANSNRGSAYDHMIEAQDADRRGWEYIDEQRKIQAERKAAAAAKNKATPAPTPTPAPEKKIELSPQQRRTIDMTQNMPTHGGGHD